MLNYIWAGMILLGVIYGVCTGQMSALTGGALDSAREAVSLCITMAGVMALWMGLMEIAQESGMIAKMTKGIRPFLKFMFPRLPEDHPAGEYITTNLIANVLGLGWACTPAGLKAMEQLAELEKQRAEQRRIEQQRMQPVNRQLRPVAGQGTEKGRQGSEDRRYGAEATAASNEMCTFLILNISSLQLIPVNMIAYRSQYQPGCRRGREHFHNKERYQLCRKSHRLCGRSDQMPQQVKKAGGPENPHCHHQSYQCRKDLHNDAQALFGPFQKSLIDLHPRDHPITHDPENHHGNHNI